VDFIDSTELEYPAQQRVAHDLRDQIGRLLHRYTSVALENTRLEREAYVARARSPTPLMPESEAARLAQFIHDMQELERRRDYFATTDITRTFQGQMIPLIEKIIAADPSVKKVVNIGAHYAYADSVLAQRFPEVDFLSVDFAANLAEFNAEFIRPNLQFRPGYAMKMLLENALDADVFFMSSTCVVIQHHELQAYFDEFFKRARYVALNEPIYVAPGGLILDPQSLRADESRPVFQYVDFEGDPGSLCYVHPYRKMLEQSGFKVPYYHAFQPDFSDLRLVQLIAQK
jgi:hypothetical protein